MLPSFTSQEKILRQQANKLSAQNFQATFGLWRLFLHPSKLGFASRGSVPTSAASFPTILPIPSLTAALDDGRFHLGSGPLQQHRMAADVLSLHLPRRPEVIVAVAETHEAIAFALGGPFVPDNPSLLDRGVFRERLQE